MSPDRVPAEREDLSMELIPRTIDEMMELIPEARSRQEAILICVSNELERRRSRVRDTEKQN